MFDNLLGDLEGQQEKVADSLSKIEVRESLEGVEITGNAKKEISNIAISEELFIGDKDMLEDLLITVVNRFIRKAEEIGVSETSRMMQELLPPGFGDMFKKSL